MSTCANVGSFTESKTSVVQTSNVGFTSEVPDYLVVHTGPDKEQDFFFFFFFFSMDRNSTKVLDPDPNQAGNKFLFAQQTRPLMPVNHVSQPTAVRALNRNACGTHRDGETACEASSNTT